MSPSGRYVFNGTEPNMTTCIPSPGQLILQRATRNLGTSMGMKFYASSPKCIRKRRLSFSIFNREKLPSTWQSRHLLIRLFTKRVMAFRFASASWVGSMQAINLLVRSSAISQHLSDPDDDSCLPTIDVFSSFGFAIVLSATGTSVLLPASPMPSKKRANESATYVTYGPMRLAGECDY